MGSGHFLSGRSTLKHYHRISLLKRRIISILLEFIELEPGPGLWLGICG